MSNVTLAQLFLASAFDMAARFGDTRQCGADCSPPPSNGPPAVWVGLRIVGGAVLSLRSALQGNEGQKHRYHCDGDSENNENQDRAAH